MRTSLRATIAIVMAFGVLLVAAVAGAGTPPSDSRSAMEDAGSGGGGGTAAMCLEGVPDCVDTVDPGTGGGSVDGWDGQGSPPDRGVPGDIVDDPLCGVEVVEGEGPDGTVSYLPCPGEEPIPTEPGPQIVEPTPGMANVYPRPFDTATIGDDGRTVTIDFWSGVEPCYVLDHVDVAYGDDTVTITLIEGSDLSGGEDIVCIEIALMKQVVITLDEPLGDRQIADGAASKGDPAA